MSTDTSPAIHSGNYYSFGAQRVVSRLKLMGIAVSPETVSVQQGNAKRYTTNDGVGYAAFSPLELAMLRHFEGRDYVIAQALIHLSPAKAAKDLVSWHAIYGGSDNPVAEISGCILSPSLIDAVAVVVGACDAAGLLISKCEQNNGDLRFFIGSNEVARIERIKFEPFALENRNRVQGALKTLRQYGEAGRLSTRLRQLPGFDSTKLSLKSTGLAAEQCMLLGFPSNWAAAMRLALQSVRIEVKLSQAQELTAVFFGANSWHQLISHQDADACLLQPVAVTCEENGQSRYRFYRTAEEAIFATGLLLKAWHEPLVVDDVRLAISGKYPVLVSCVSAADKAKASLGTRVYLDTVITCGYEDVRDGNEHSDEMMRAANDLLAAMKTQDNPVTVLRAEDNLVAGFMAAQARAGVPPERVIQLGAYYLSFRLAENERGTDYLNLYFADGSIKTVASGIALYKASLDYCPNENGKGGEFVITADYGGERIASIPVGSLEDTTPIVRLLEKSVGSPILVRSLHDVRLGNADRTRAETQTIS